MRVKQNEGAGKLRVFFCRGFGLSAGTGHRGTKHERAMGAAGDGHGGHGHARGWAEVPITPLITNYKPPRLTDKQSDTQVYLKLVALEHASGRLDFGQMTSITSENTGLSVHWNSTVLRSQRNPPPLPAPPYKTGDQYTRGVSERPRDVQERHCTCHLATCAPRSS